MVYICIDIETSGPAPGLFSMLSIGAVEVVRREGGWEAGESLYLELQPLPLEAMNREVEDARLRLQGVLDAMR